MQQKPTYHENYQDHISCFEELGQNVVVLVISLRGSVTGGSKSSFLIGIVLSIVRTRFIVHDEVLASITEKL